MVIFTGHLLIHAVKLAELQTVKSNVNQEDRFNRFCVTRGREISLLCQSVIHEPAPKPAPITRISHTTEPFAVAPHDGNNRGLDLPKI